MVLDHSLTYKDRSLRNLPHRMRLSKILSICDSICDKGPSYADIGCSNGYITEIIRTRYSFNEVVGFDNYGPNLEVGAQNHKDIEFKIIDLNTPVSERKFDFVTCFETLEHVGALDAALYNILGMCNPGGHILISVPIETGFWGIIKVLVKTGFNKETLDELSTEPGFKSRYIRSLLFNEDISRYRGSREAYFTHYGFDYRVVDKLLKARGVKYSRMVYFTTAFFIIEM